VTSTPPVVAEFGERLTELGWVLDLLVAGSLATGDYALGVSDLDLVAVVQGPVDEGRSAALTALHRRLDQGPGAGLDLGCIYVNVVQLFDLQALHATWTHGVMVEWILSGITRAELVRHGFAIVGRPPLQVFPQMGDEDVRQAARAELLGYWGWATRRPWMWLDPVLADLGLTSMARGRHTLVTGELLTKTRAVEKVDAPAWLRGQLRARRRGENVTSPRLRTAVLAWRDARRTVASARRPAADTSRLSR
jgi:hypothetical protein